METKKSTLGDRIESENKGFLAFKSMEDMDRYFNNIYGNTANKEKPNQAETSK